MPLKLYPLPKDLRERLGKPLGELFKADELAGERFQSTIRETNFVITVGDRVTETIYEAGRIPEIQVVDLKERRVERDAPDVPYRQLLRARNPAGTVTADAIKKLTRAFKMKERPVRLQIEGEEDLLALPVAAMAPMGSVFLYGQPKVGVVLVRVDERGRSSAKKMLESMKAEEGSSE